MQILTKIVVSTVAVFVTGSTAMAAPVLDGSGFGAPSAIVVYDPAAPTSNFGAPGPTTSGASYNIYSRGDATYAYFLVQQTGSGASAGPFANFYFGTGATATSGSDVGFEVANSDVFSPGSGNAPISTTGTGIAFSVLNGGNGIEFAVPFTYFETDPQAIGFSKTTAANPGIVLRLSQSFGYSVAGGAFYGPNRLGLVVDPISAAAPVPEPASIALMAAGLIGLASRRKRK